MPKVKFTALVAGMSGKSQGSVFASNASGAYFRNNTSKVKPKTAANSLKKAAFTTMSQYWRTLSFTQQAAWKAAAPNFPTLNAFGDPVIPSGYQLFMSLNTARSTANLPPLLEPPVGRSLPDPGAIELDNPDFFQYIPQAFLGTYSKNDPSVVSYYTNSTIMTNMLITDLGGISLRISFNGTPVFDPTTNGTIGLMYYIGSGNQKFTLELVRQVNGFWKLVYAQFGTGGSWELTSLDFRIDFTSTLSIGVIFTAPSPEDAALFVNGVAVTEDAQETGDPVFAASSGPLIIGDAEQRITGRYFISDFRVLGTIGTAGLMKLISQGYVLETETAIWQFSNLDADRKTFSSYGAEGEFFLLAAPLSPRSVITPMSANLIPSMILTVPNDGLSGVLLNIYATPAISNGRGGETSNWRLLTQVPWSAPLEIEISDLWLTKFGGYPVGSNISFKIEVFDSETGYIPASAIKPPRKTRFKAGSEISAHVNK